YSAPLIMLKNFLTLILIVTIGSALLAQTPKPEVTQYTCVMHPEVVQDHPGKCPKCGMELVPVTEDKKHRISNGRTIPARGTEGRASARPVSRTSQDHGVHDHAMHEMKMQSSVNLADPMSREGSGTSWLPDSSPMYGRMFMFGQDMLMLH